MNDPLTKPAVQTDTPAADTEASAMGCFLAALHRCAGKTARPEDVVRRVSEIAFSRPNDALALACGQRGSLETMDLAAVAEFKCKDDSGEVKFVDRLRALELLWTLLGGSGGGDGAARDFLQALEDAGAGHEGDGGRR